MGRGGTALSLVDLLRIGDCKGGLRTPCITDVESILRMYCEKRHFNDYMLFYYSGEHPFKDKNKVVLSSYPVNWVKTKISKDYDEVDPVGRCVNRRNKSVYMPYGTRRMAFQKCLDWPKGATKAARDRYTKRLTFLKQEAQNNNREDGLFYTSQHKNKTVSLSLSSDLRGDVFEKSMDVAAWEELIEVVGQIASALEHTVSCALCSHQSDTGLFTKAEKTLLIAVNQNVGKTLEEIATILGKSVSTINKQLVPIREKLGVGQAKPAVKASALGAEAKHRGHLD